MKPNMPVNNKGGGKYEFLKCLINLT